MYFLKTLQIYVLQISPIPETNFTNAWFFSYLHHQCIELKAGSSCSIINSWTCNAEFFKATTSILLFLYSRFRYLPFLFNRALLFKFISVYFIYLSCFVLVCYLSVEIISSSFSFRRLSRWRQNNFTRINFQNYILLPKINLKKKNSWFSYFLFPNPLS